MKNLMRLSLVLILFSGFASGLNAQEFGEDQGFFKVTYYWIAYESFFSGSATFPLYDVRGRTLAMVSEEFARAVTMEGTGLLNDGRILNLHKRCKRAELGWCFMEVNRKKAPWGYGSAKPLRPFRTIAVNSIIKPGTVVFLPDFIGITMPSGEGGVEYHDGCFVAEDVGWSLGNRHIDIFALAENYYKVISSSIGGKNRVRIYTHSPLCPDDPDFFNDPESWVNSIR